MSRDALLERFRATRRLSSDLAKPLKPEDYRIQSMPDVSPPWWNLGHTTWFFAKNLLEPHGLYGEADRRFEYVLNSYYEAHGERVPRAERGLQTRPTTAEILEFRERVDERVERLVQDVPDDLWQQTAFLVETGIQHEQQHQELFVTEIKHILGSNAPELREAYLARNGPSGVGSRPHAWIELGGGLDEFGNLEGGWCFDNELPVHRSFVEPFALGERLVTNGEFLEFVEDGGYRQPLLWLANGWDRVRREGWQAPLYWEGGEGDRRVWCLCGASELDLDEPVAHVGFYEADAFARWKGETDPACEGARLPTEHEWEMAARRVGYDAEAGNFLDDGLLHPRVLAEEPNGSLPQGAGELWEWTSSHYEAYPGYRPFAGDLQEYNGKFMDNQRVLRGGSCATPRSHIRASYRNFWAPETRFQFTGIRLARSAESGGR